MVRGAVTLHHIGSVTITEQFLVPAMRPAAQANFESAVATVFSSMQVASSSAIHRAARGRDTFWPEPNLPIPLPDASPGAHTDAPSPHHNAPLLALLRPASNLLKVPVIIYTYNHHARLLPSEPSVVKQPKSTRIEGADVVMKSSAAPRRISA